MELIQTCYSLESEKTRNREIRALLKAGKELGCKKLTILTLREAKEEMHEWFGIKGVITNKPIVRWLLESTY